METNESIGLNSDLAEAVGGEGSIGVIISAPSRIGALSTLADEHAIVQEDPAAEDI